jgi:hypothetical protein
MESFRAAVISLTNRIEQTSIPYFNAYFVQDALVIRTFILLILSVVAVIFGNRVVQKLPATQRSPVLKSAVTMIVFIAGALCFTGLVLSLCTQSIAALLVAAFAILWAMKIRGHKGIKIFTNREFLCLVLAVLSFGLGWFLFAP